MVTIFDVAERAGVGVSTVSRVLNDSPRVSEATRQRVLAAIQDLDYRPSNLARGLSRGTTNTIGLVVPFFTEPSFVERLRGVVSVLSGTEWEIVLYGVENQDQRDQRIADMTRPHHAAAYLLVSLPITTAERTRILKSGTPVAVVDACVDGLPSYFVRNEEGGYLATRYLLNLGHERVAIVGGGAGAPFGYAPERERLAGYRRAMDEAGLGTTEIFDEALPDDPHHMKRLGEALFSQAELPTAIFATSDKEALGVLEIARSRGLRVPEDLSVVGFDNIDLATYTGLSTVDQSLFESGQAAARCLVAALEDDDWWQAQPVELPLSVVPRRTTASPSAADQVDARDGASG